MHDLVVECRAQGVTRLMGAEAADPAGVGRRIVGKTPGELLAGGVTDADDITLVKLAGHLENPNRQQALGVGFRRSRAPSSTM